jgi:hypothetical protein
VSVVSPPEENEQMARTEPDFDLRAAHRYFATHCFNHTWTLMDASTRTAEEQQEMLDASHASLWHWRQRGDFSPVKLAIAYWQLSRVHALLGSASESERYAKLSLANASEPNTPIFHTADAFEALARAASIAHDPALTAEYLGQARALGQQVEDAEERQMLFDDIDNIQR